MNRTLRTIAAGLLLATGVHAQTVIADLKAYGKSCGDIQIIPSQPLIGTTFEITTKSKDAIAGFVAFGFQRADLPIGGGCSIYLDPIVLTGWAGTPGLGKFSVPIPNSNALLGAIFTTQTTAANRAGMAFSIGIEGKVGNKRQQT